MNFYDELANIFDEDKVTDDTHFFLLVGKVH